MNTLKLNTISKNEFEIIRKFVFKRSGINLTEVKKPLVIARLLRRLRNLKLNNFTEYIDYLKHKDLYGKEAEEMINRISTNKTDFFREEYHFQYLFNNILPEIKNGVNIWCAASSTGEEPYSIAITLMEYMKKNHRIIDFNLSASDISTEVLEKAAKGIYTVEDVAGLQEEWIKSYFLKGYGSKQGKVRIKSLIRNRINFMHINLMDPKYPIVRNQDIIFLRNTLIYFKNETKKDILKKIWHYLCPGGYLFLGHSESLFSLDTNFECICKTIYQKPLGR